MPTKKNGVVESCRLQRPVCVKGSAYFENTTSFIHLDHLRSTRLLTKVDQTVRESDDYYPFGELIPSGPTTGDINKFTGKECDSESGLDNFEARYYSSSLGRFMRPDPMGGHVEDPQTLNRYAYAHNNPTSLTDPTGLDFYLSCAPGTDADGKQVATSTCQEMTVGYDKNGNAQQAWVQGVTGDNGFTATQINQHQSYDTVVLAGNMPGFLFTFQNSKLEAGQTSAGFSPQDSRKTRGRADRYSFLVRLFHPLLQAGLAPSTVTRILRQPSHWQSSTRRIFFTDIVQKWDNSSD